VRLSHKSETVAENGETTATVSLLWDSLTFLQQCGQAIGCRCLCEQNLRPKRNGCSDDALYSDASAYGTLTRSCAVDINKVKSAKNTSRLQSLFYPFGKVRRHLTHAQLYSPVVVAKLE